MAKKINRSKVILSDLVDKKTVERILKTFHKTFGFGCSCVDENKVIANIPFAKFCKMTRNSKLGCEFCENCDKAAWEKISKTRKPTIYKCHAGLIDIAIPIFVDNKYLGAIMGGQFLTENLKEKSILDLSEKLGIKEREEYLLSAKKIKKIKLSEAKKAMKMLALVAETISETAYSKYELQKETDKKEFILSLVNVVENTVSKDKLYSSICKMIMKFFNADRIMIVEFYKNGLYNIMQELKVDKSIKSISEVLPIKMTEKIMSYWNDIIFNLNKEVTFNSVNSYDIPDFIRDAYNKIGLVSAMTTIFNRTETTATVVVMGKYDNNNAWTEDDVKGFNLCAKQVNIAINKIKLTEKANINALREKALLDNLPASAFLKDVNGKFLAVNDEFLTCGLTREQILGHDDFEFEPYEIASSYQAEDLEVIKTKKPFRNVRKVVRDGKEIWFESFKSPVFDEKGNVIAITGFNKDVTAQMMMDNLKNQFLSIISHELRTPLTSIAGSIDLILNGLVGDIDTSCAEMLKIAKKNTTKLTTLISNILELEGLEANTIKLNLSKQEVKPILLKAIKMTEKPTTAFDVKIVPKIELKDECAKVDSEKLLQLFSNLISNAYKFSNFGETIPISAKVKKKDIVVTITNTGVQIPTGMEDSIFNRFKQIDEKSNPQNTSVGLGLAIAKLLADKMHGTIGYTSKNNVTTFTVTLPLIK